MMFSTDSSRLLVRLAAVLLLATGLSSGRLAAAAASPAIPPSGNYIVVYRDGVEAEAQTAALERALGFQSRFRYEAAIKGFAAGLAPEQVTRLQADPAVAFISPDRAVSITGSAPVAAGETVPTGVRRVNAATNSLARQAGNSAVAVIDTGIDLSHPDLNAVDGVNCISPGNPAQDDHGHGTHVAGTIAARNNAVGVIGVVPGTAVYAVKVLNSAGSGTWSQVICGIDWVTQNATALNIKVANMSLGGSGSSDNNCGSTNSDALHAAICNSVAAGVTYVASAGNNSTDLAGFVPAAYGEVLAVTAMADSDGARGGMGGSPACSPAEVDDTYASFSNYAVASADVSHTLAAPGVCIYSTWLGGGYNTLSGTSMAAPHVTGSVSLCIGEGGAAGPCAGLTPGQIVQKLRSDAESASTADAGYGFSGDPLRLVAGRTYGYQLWNNPPEGFALSLTPASQAVVQGAGASYTVTITRLNGFAGAVSLSLAGLPAGATATWSENPAAGSAATLSVLTNAATPAGSYPLIVTGVSAALTRTASATFVVNLPPDFGISASPASLSVGRSKSGSYAVSVQSLNGFAGPATLSVSGLPSGASASFSTNPVSLAAGATGKSTLKVTGGRTMGTFTLTIAGTGGGIKHSLQVVLQITR